MIQRLAFLVLGLLAFACGSSSPKTDAGSNGLLEITVEPADQVYVIDGAVAATGA